MALPNNQIPGVYIDTGLEYELIKDFVNKLAEKDKRIVIIKPNVSLNNLLKEYGYPFKSKDFSAKVNIYQRKGLLKGLQNYLNLKGACACPNKLRYMFTEQNKIKISDKCCLLRKEQPLQNWASQNNKPIAIVGLMNEEGGRRDNINYNSKRKEQGCFIEYAKKKFFYPLRVVTKDFEEWFIKEKNIEICSIYYPPYNFKRTGCKGCPYAVDLNNVLEVMERYFPNKETMRNHLETYI